MEAAERKDEQALSVDALREWERHLEDVLRGVAHALNNRAASVSAVLELSMESDRSDSATRAMLAAEVQRLHELVAIVRTVGSPRDSVVAFDARDGLTAARGIMGVHAGMRERSITLDAPIPTPVRSRQGMFIRAVVALAARASGPGPGTTTITMTERDHWAEVRAASTEGAPGVRSRYADEVARAMGGEPLADAPGFRLPTLTELRRREGREA